MECPKLAAKAAKMSSRTPVRGNHAIAMDVRVKSSNEYGGRRSPNSAFATSKRNSAGSRTPSPNMARGSPRSEKKKLRRRTPSPTMRRKDHVENGAENSDAPSRKGIGSVVSRFLAIQNQMMEENEQECAEVSRAFEKGTAATGGGGGSRMASPSRRAPPAEQRHQQRHFYGAGVVRADAKAPADTMFSSRRPRLTIDTASTSLAATREQQQQQQQSASSPETVISSEWSSSNSPRHSPRAFSYHPPPSFIPRIKLEALHSPRGVVRGKKSIFDSHSPDPNKAAAPLSSPFSAFRSTSEQSLSSYNNKVLPPHCESAVDPYNEDDDAGSC